MKYKLIFTFIFKIIIKRLCDFHIDIVDTLARSVHKEIIANDFRRTYLRYVLHEVRVPLNSIVLGISLLKQEASSEPNHNNTLSMMDESARFMSETLNDVLSIEKMEDGALTLKYEYFSLTKMIEGSFQALQGSALSKRINLSIDDEDYFQFNVLGDRFRLEHVVSNLVSNAIKFSPEGSNISVNIKSDEIKEDQREYTISVIDQGVGISKEDMAKLFVPFNQINAEDLQRGQGSGLGLVLARDIVELHGGTLECLSEPNVGTTFVIKLNLSVSAPPMRSFSVKSNSFTSSSYVAGTKELTNNFQSKGLSCLVVDGTSKKKCYHLNNLNYYLYFLL